MECDFCDISSLKNRIINENDFAFVFPSNTPIVPGHLLIVPKRHVQYYEDLTSEEKTSIEDLRVWSKKSLRNVFGAQGFNYAWNEEAIGGQSVPHFHLHIVPRTENDAGIYEYEPRKFLYRPGSRAESPEEELADVVKLLKQE